MTRTSKNAMINTEQLRVYERAYRECDSEYGMPDRKIAFRGPLRDKRILVLGCGMGTDVWYLAKDNQVVGVDYASSGLDMAHQHGLEVLDRDLNLDASLPFQGQRFDVAVCKDILEHLLDPLAVLQEIRRVLRDDGYVVISVPNHFALPMRLRMLLGKGVIYRSCIEDHSVHYDEWNYMHIRFFTYNGFRRLLRSAGLSPARWFWDFGNLAHYHQPEMWLEPQLWKRENGAALSRRAKLAVSVIRPAWRLFNIVFPRPLRHAAVSACPGLLSGGFYVCCNKSADATPRRAACEY